MKISERSQSSLTMDAYQAGVDVLVVLKGRLVLENCERFRDRLQILINPKVSKIYLHLAALEYVDSAGWGSLVGLKTSANRNRSRMCFLSPSDRILDIFRISKLDAIFDVKSGSEAEIIRATIARPENLLWQESEESSADSLARIPSSSGVKMKDPARDRDLQQWMSEAAELLRMGEYQKVIEVYQKVLEVEAENITALNNLGIVYEKKPEWYEKAVEAWERVLRVSEKNLDEPHRNRAQRHLESLGQLKNG